MYSFIFHGRSSTEFGLVIERGEFASSPSPKVSQIYIPGRNGALLQSEEYYENRTVKYEVFVKVKEGDSLPNHLRKIKGWLLSDTGYHYLEDSKDPDFLFKAAYISGVDFTIYQNRIARSSLTFTAKPFQYLRSGLHRRAIVNGVKLKNPTEFTALPYFKIYGQGDITLTVNHQSFVFRGVNEYIEMDSEIMNVFKDTLNANQQKEGDGFPTLKVGENGILWSGNITKVEIEPRWRTL